MVLFLFLAGNSCAQSGSRSKYGNNKKAGHFIELNGVKLYYEDYGKGKPIIVLHGNGGNISAMSPQIDYFSKNNRVIVMDCRGRGKSELGKDSLTYIQMTKDLNGLLNHLKLDSTYIIGRGDGAIIGLLLAVNYPDKAKKIAAFEINITPGTDELYDVESITAARKHAEQMLAENDTSDNWFLIRQLYRLVEFQRVIPPDDLKKIQCPVLILSCDRDTAKDERSFSVYRNIRKSNLCIFNGQTSGMTNSAPALFNVTVENFFSERIRSEEIGE
ncbi:hypothetical protein FEDK69T_23510 [Flavobacterium enshiense DK69]|nr:hypothetical protein FEDK69T_23510 [Flavobacterium enshiense DK69]